MGVDEVPTSLGTIDLRQLISIQQVNTIQCGFRCDERVEHNLWYLNREEQVVGEPHVVEDKPAVSENRVVHQKDLYQLALLCLHVHVEHTVHFFSIRSQSRFQAEVHDLELVVGTDNIGGEEQLLTWDMLADHELWLFVLLPHRAELNGFLAEYISLLFKHSEVY